MAKSVTLFKAITLLLFLVSLSCSHFQTAEYVSGAKDFSTADEYMNSPEVAQNRVHENKGPFRLHWPVLEPKVNRGFGEGRGNHLGVDIGGKRNTSIKAAHDGVVVYAGARFRGYGRMIIVEYDQEWATLYGHLNKFSVKTGQKVTAGQEIGKMGRTGRATGVHLHFELIKGKKPVDPMPFLKNEAIVTSLFKFR